MALSFLSNLINNVTPIAQSIGGLADAFGYDVYQASNRAGRMSPAEAQAQGLLAELSKENSPYVGRMTDAQMRANSEALLGQLRSMAMRDQRSMARGVRGTFFDPERADETINYLTSRGAPFLRQQAEQSARNDIMNNANLLRGLAPYGQERINTQNDILNRYGEARQASGGYANTFGNIASNIQNLLGAFRGPSSLYG